MNKFEKDYSRPLLIIIGKSEVMFFFLFEWIYFLF